MRFMFREGVLAGLLVATVPSVLGAQLVNTGLEVSWLTLPLFAGSRVVAVVRESSSVDWNADGDQLDDVFVAIDPTSGQVVHVGLAAAAFASGLTTTSGLVYTYVSEASQGATDLNGDGDASDFVACRFDAETGATSVVPAVDSWRFVAEDGSRVLVDLRESPGNDFNFDNDVLDLVLHQWNPTTGALTNLGLVAAKVIPLPGGDAIVEAPELQNSLDWNGDGDVVDVMIRQLDISALAWVTTPFQGSIESVSGSFVAVSEFEIQIGSDLNNDGDTNDRIVGVWDAAAQVAVHGTLSGSNIRSSGSRVVFVASEVDSAATDLNGDGDAIDVVLTEMNAITGATQFIREARNTFGGVFFDLSGSRVAYPTSEPWLLSQGLPADRNGDGDALDSVMTVRDLATGVVDHGRAVQGSPWFRLFGDFVGYDASESAEKLTDLDFNGTKFGHVFIVDRFLGDSRSSFAGQSMALPTLVAGGSGAAGRMLVLFSESVAKRDFNGDGDTTDSVPFDIDLSAGTQRNLGVGVDYAVPSPTHVALTVSESQQGSDLNGDGDSVDVILEISTAAPGQSGVVANYGAGCSTSLGKPAELEVHGAVAASGQVIVQVNGGVTGSKAWFMMSGAPASIPIGLGCPLLIAPPITVPIGPFTSIVNGMFGSSATVFAGVPATIPPSVSIYLQAFLEDPVLGIVPTDGVHLTTG